MNPPTPGTLGTGFLLLAIVVMGAVTFGTRVFPFVVFSHHKPGPRFKALQDRLPALILVILVLWAVKDIAWTKPVEVCATLGCLVLAGTLQAWKRNALVSIFLPTIIFMVVRALT